MVNYRVNTKEATAKIRSIGRELRRAPEIEDAMLQVGQRILTFTRRRFETNSRSGGNSEWRDLAVSTKMKRLSKTKAQRAKLDRQAKQKGTSRTAVLRAIARATKLPILVDTAIMRNSLSILEIRQTQVFIGTQIQYAKRHQLGDGVPRRTIVTYPDNATLLSCKRDVDRGLEKMLARLRAKKTPG